MAKRLFVSVALAAAAVATQMVGTSEPAHAQLSECTSWQGGSGICREEYLHWRAIQPMVTWSIIVIPTSDPTAPVMIRQ